MLRKLLQWLKRPRREPDVFWYQRALYDAFERNDREWAEYLAQRAAVGKDVTRG